MDFPGNRGHWMSGDSHPKASSNPAEASWVVMTSFQPKGVSPNQYRWTLIGQARAIFRARIGTFHAHLLPQTLKASLSVVSLVSAPWPWTNLILIEVNTEYHNCFVLWYTGYWLKTLARKWLLRMAYYNSKRKTICRSERRSTWKAL